MSFEPQLLPLFEVWVLVSKDGENFRSIRCFNSLKPFLGPGAFPILYFCFFLGWSKCHLLGSGKTPGLPRASWLPRSHKTTTVMVKKPGVSFWSSSLYWFTRKGGCYWLIHTLFLVVPHHEFWCIDFCCSKQSQRPSYSLVKNELKKS